ncbi:hypothetical protein L3X38_023121 [Prunus dulcis]|uniref:Uncharacterized protein n=1 Tax=Prunus dulcis TaxID=3755 RepID=A0AAD4Z472_PRUDU|nr:hypothetical protein L3X38_023121 [Prunus dulcis]
MSEPKTQNLAKPPTRCQSLVQLTKSFQGLRRPTLPKDPRAEEFLPSLPLPSGKGRVRIEGRVTKNTKSSLPKAQPFLPKYLNEAQLAQSWPPLPNGNGHVHGPPTKPSSPHLGSRKFKRPSLLAKSPNFGHHGPSLLLYAKPTNA